MKKKKFTPPGFCFDLPLILTANNSAWSFYATIFLPSVFELFWRILLYIANDIELLELEMYHTATVVFKCPVLACRQHHDLSIIIKQCQNSPFQLLTAFLCYDNFEISYIIFLLQLFKDYLQEIIKRYGELFFTPHFICSFEIKMCCTHWCIMLTAEGFLKLSKCDDSNNISFIFHVQEGELIL